MFVSCSGIKPDQSGPSDRKSTGCSYRFVFIILKSSENARLFEGKKLDTADTVAADYFVNEIAILAY